MEKTSKPYYVCFKVQWANSSTWSPSPENAMAAIAQLNFEKLIDALVKNKSGKTSVDMGFCKISADLTIGE